MTEAKKSGAPAAGSRKHTPGPWALRGYQIRADDGHGAHVATYQISEADGQLIAAAPALADALARARYWFEAEVIPARQQRETLLRDIEAALRAAGRLTSAASAPTAPSGPSDPESK